MAPKHNILEKYYFIVFYLPVAPIHNILKKYNFIVFYLPVAQLDSASDSDSEGRRFESCRAGQQKTHFCLPTKVRFLNDVCLWPMMLASPMMTTPPNDVLLRHILWQTSHHCETQWSNIILSEARTSFLIIMVQINVEDFTIFWKKYYIYYFIFKKYML